MNAPLDKPTTAATKNPLSNLKLTDVEYAVYVAAVEEHMKERAKQQGITFNAVDFLMGASVFFAEVMGMGAVPASWIFGIMQGYDPLTGKRPSSLEEAKTETRRALENLRNALRQYESAEGGLSGYDAIAKAVSATEKASRIVDAMVRQEAANN